ncbi:1-acyl-sn-glycerol-3-phosphate acyltransferase [Conyzicola lurida]|uniref:1-acyl-sn-glycerol-3-phosphate acyltransferase n=1 Tax=Conyzicola lurida TaxID=1172621 RepID=A0A841ANB9_9MICO|nr:lysophospholipid acyltransferase family protein [Conyzicola lurida]MBB5842919.1 1-acyl-sn-glycerol-3-phosphate acyltransferase [Conyzicola lurida]
MTRRGAEPIYSTAIGVGRALFGALRVKPAITGAENFPAQGGAVLAITHFGYLDFALVEWMMWKANRRHIRFLAQKGAFDKPGVGFVLRGMHHISVDMTAGADAYRAAVQALRDGEVLGVFPEGGVSASFEVRELKSGAVRMAAEAGVPVIPVAVWGGHRLKTKSAGSSLREKFGVPVRFAVGTPFTPSPEDDAADVTLGLQRSLQTLVGALQADYPVDGTGAWWQPARLGGSAPTPEVAAVEEAARKARKAREAAERRR